MRGDFPPIKSLSTHPNNLPQQLTSFIGREKEIAEVEALLDQDPPPHAHRLRRQRQDAPCLQVAADSLEQFPDGVWLVELAPLADPGLVPQTVATRAGREGRAGQAHQRRRSPNTWSTSSSCCFSTTASTCSTPARQLADALVRHCPGVKILATSREALGIAGEQTYRVPSLSLPDRKRCRRRRSFRNYESVQLFIDRALLVRADFAVTNQNAPALASVCCHLDGIPLAIELAAARVRTLSVEEIDGKLDQRFRLLTGGSRTALPRQQTLRSLIDWSYDLLHEPETAALAATVGLCRRVDVGGGGTGLRRRGRGGARRFSIC